MGEQNVDAANLVYRGVEGSGAAQVFDRVNMQSQQTAIALADEQRKEEEAKAAKVKAQKAKDLNDAYAGLANVGAGSWFKHSQYFDEAAHDLTNMVASDPTLLDPVKNPKGYVYLKEAQNKYLTQAKYSNQIQKDVEGMRDEIAKNPDQYEPDDIIALNAYASKPFKEIIAAGETVPMVRKKPDYSKWYKELYAIDIPLKKTEIENGDREITDTKTKEDLLKDALKVWLKDTEQGQMMVKYHKGDEEKALDSAIKIKRTQYKDEFKNVLSSEGKDKAKSAREKEEQGRWHANQLDNIKSGFGDQVDLVDRSNNKVKGSNADNAFYVDKTGYLKGSVIGEVPAMKLDTRVEITQNGKKVPNPRYNTMIPVTDSNGKPQLEKEIIEQVGYDPHTSTYLVKTSISDEWQPVGATELLRRSVKEKEFYNTYDHMKRSGYLDPTDKFIGKSGTANKFEAPAPKTISLSQLKADYDFGKMTDAEIRKFYSDQGYEITQ